jgi:hypothetical protein|tara:strand:+ start:5909 stop:6340 length:432 start_codon:yes stop_codon:yes gene_type:complete
MSTQIEMVEDDEIEEIHEKKTLLHKSIPKKSTFYNCCRACMVLTAMVIFVLMLVQLWSNYGEYIQNRVMAPSIAGAGEFNREGAITQFVMKYHQWTNNTLHINITKPTSYMVLTAPDTPHTWIEGCLKFTTESEDLKVIVYSM